MQVPDFANSGPSGAKPRFNLTASSVIPVDGCPGDYQVEFTVDAATGQVHRTPVDIVCVVDVSPSPLPPRPFPPRVPELQFFSFIFAKGTSVHLRINIILAWPMALGLGAPCWQLRCDLRPLLTSILTS